MGTGHLAGARAGVTGGNGELYYLLLTTLKNEGEAMLIGAIMPDGKNCAKTSIQNSRIHNPKYL